MQNKNFFQYENSHKFSTDALLLAQFAPLEKVKTFAELGTGCGIIALEIMEKLMNDDESLLKEKASAIAIDYNSKLLESAKENAKLYAHAERIFFIEEDLEKFPNVNNSETKKFKNSCDLVICNPPWLMKNQGKLPKESMKQNALFGDENTYDIFFSGAKYFVKERGFLCFISIAERLELIFAALKKNGFALKKMQFVHKNSENSSIFVLFLAEYKGKSLTFKHSDLKILPPLFLE